MRKLWGKTAAVLLAGAMVLSICATPASAAKKKAFDPKGTYHATMGLQTATKIWITRMGYYEKSQNENYGTKFNSVLQAKDPSAKVTNYDGTFKDAKIAGNGTYTVSLTGADFGGETTISQLHVATDIPLKSGVKFSHVTASIDGKEIATFEEAVHEDETPYLAGGDVILIANHWRGELVKKLSAMGQSETGANGYEWLTGQGDENVSITFTVSGFSYDNPKAVAATKKPAAKPEAGKTVSSKKSNTGLLVGCIGGGIAVLIIVEGVIVSRKKK